ncbi:GntR family transcriptional regulator [Chelatococcus asaccharovorans]|nr:GntR family transcriptional regulator [Chelatococcus asaccharovorans]
MRQTSNGEVPSRNLHWEAPLVSHRQSLTFQYIKNYVTHNVLSDRAPINVQALANAIGVSHIPVREALFRASHEGLIRHRAEKGFFAKSLSQTDIVQACSISRAIAVVGLDEVFLHGHQEAIVAVGLSAERCRRALCESANADHAFWWIEAIIRRLARTCYPRQPRWHLLRIFDQTLAFRRVVSHESQAAFELAPMLAQLTEQIAAKRLDLAVGSIDAIIAHEMNRFTVHYQRYAEAVMRARRLQNSSAGTMEGVLLNIARPALVKRGNRNPQQHH